MDRSLRDERIAETAEPNWTIADGRPVSSGRLKLTFVLLAALWLLCDAVLLTPTFGGLDIYYFKDPGANLAEGLGFVSRFTYGNPSLEYHTYSQYPPLYPFLYGVFASLFGVTLRSNQIFNSLINLGCGIVGYALLWPMLRDFGAGRKWRWTAPWVQTAMFVAAIVTGFFKPEQDRPDALAVVIAGLAVLLVRGRLTNGRAFAACALCALTFFVSPFTSIWACIAVFAVAVAVLIAERRDPAAIVQLAASGGAGGLLTGVAALGLIAWLLPDWFAGFSGVVTGASTRNETGGGYFMLLLHGDVRGWAEAFVDFTKHGAGTLVVNFGKLAIAQVALIAATLWEARQSRAAGRRWQGPVIVGLVLASPLCIVIMPYQFSYLRITAGLLLMAAACVTMTMRRGARPPYALAIVAAYGAITLTAVPKLFLEIAGRAVDGPSLDRAQAYIRDHRDLADEPAGKYLAVSSETYMLFRQEGVRPLAIVYSGFADPADRRHLDKLALSYARSVDPLTPVFPDWYSDNDFVQQYAPRLPQTHAVAGIPVGSGSVTWESAIFRHQAQ